jgi:hypothetical protein
MNHSRYRGILGCIAFLLLCCTSLYAQLSLGRMTFAAPPALTLSNPSHLDIGLPTHSFLAGVGGVAFDAVAAPVEGTSIESLSLTYHADSSDGNRLWLNVNGRSVGARIYDWQLAPTVNFTNSQYYSGITPFGKLVSQPEQSKVLKRGGNIVNYHPALVNTVLGLRIFQQDILILRNDCTDLPKDGNRYILGKGEREPDLWENQMGMNNFIIHLNRVESEFRMRFRSYVVCDFERDIRFGLSGDTLSVTGEPFYYFWRFRMDSPEYDQDKAEHRIEKEIADSVRSARAESPSTFSERQWYTNALLQQMKEYEGRYNIYSSGTVVDLLKLSDESARRRSLDDYPLAALRLLLKQMRSAMDAYEPIYLKEYSERLSSRPEIIRGINPTVWDATTNLMRYAAFFRYCKEHFPEAWEKFVRQIEGVKVSPSVVTPTVVYYPETKPEKARSR